MTVTMDDIQAEMYARGRHMQAVDLDPFQTNIGARTLLPPAQSNHDPLGRRLTLFQGAGAVRAGTKSHQPHQPHQPLYQGRISSAVPCSLAPYQNSGRHPGTGVPRLFLSFLGALLMQ